MITFGQNNHVVNTFLLDSEFLLYSVYHYSENLPQKEMPSDTGWLQNNIMKTLKFNHQ